MLQVNPKIDTVETLYIIKIQGRKGGGGCLYPFDLLVWGFFSTIRVDGNKSNHTWECYFKQTVSLLWK